MRRYRWGDHDRHLGPITYTSRSTFQAVGFRLRSRGDDDDEDGLTVFGVHLGHVAVFMTVPHWVLRPAREWVDTSNFVGAGGPGGYWQTWPREVGVLLTRSGAVGERYDTIHVDYGRQTHSSTTTRSWTCFLAWQSMRLVRTTLLTPTLDVHDEKLEPLDPWTPRWLRKLLGVKHTSRSYDHDARRRLEDTCPRYVYRMRDFDGEEVYVHARLEEREWRRGEGCLQWLGPLCRPVVLQTVDLDFSREVGRRKDSWKGGTLSMTTPAAVADDLDASVRAAVSRDRDPRLEVLGGPTLASGKVVMEGRDG